MTTSHKIYSPKFLIKKLLLQLFSLNWKKKTRKMLWHRSRYFENRFLWDRSLSNFSLLPIQTSDCKGVQVETECRVKNSLDAVFIRRWKCERENVGNSLSDFPKERKVCTVSSLDIIFAVIILDQARFIGIRWLEVKLRLLRKWVMKLLCLFCFEGGLQSKQFGLRTWASSIFSWISKFVTNFHLSDFYGTI